VALTNDRNLLDLVYMGRIGLSVSALGDVNHLGPGDLPPMDQRNGTTETLFREGMLFLSFVARGEGKM
jgi:hypothetical protein